MGLFDKIKGILFDEEIVEVPVTKEELPERTPKKEKREETRGFRDYRAQEEVVDENPIVEVKVPKEEPIKEVVREEPKGFNLQEDFDMIEELPTRSRSYENDTQEYRVEPQVRQQERIEARIDRSREPRKDYRELAKVDTTKRNEEVKDYKRIVSENKETTFKKPFKVTPIISPVYGILDKNYTPEDINEKREQINLVNNGVTKKPRTFSSVGYSDQPLPSGNGTILKNHNLSQELVELNSTINEMMDDVKLEETREIEITRTEIKVTEQPELKETVVQEIKKPVIVKEQIEDELDKTEEIIMTPNYDELETSGIENKYIGNNNIEDAFESTSEFDKISEFDRREETEEEHAPVSIEEIINNRDKLDEEEDHLEDTIETDLFNLIDSMYKHDDEDEEEDSEE